MRYTDFGEYFAKLMQSRYPKFSQTEIARELRTSQSNISKIYKGMTLPGEDLIEQVRNKTGIDLSDAVIQASKKYKELKNTLEQKEPSVETRPRIPIYASAGSLTIYADGITHPECEEMPLIRNIPDYDFTMIIKGNSMEPKYESGDEIALRKVTNIIEWGKDYVLDTTDGAIFKKIYEQDEENIRCVSYNNQEYPDFIVPKASVFGYYRLVGLIRV